MSSTTSFLASTLPLGYIFLSLTPDIAYIQLFLVTKQTDCTSMDLTVLQTHSFSQGLSLANSDLSQEELVIVAVISIL